jgi:hypothetical protein
MMYLSYWSYFKPDFGNSHCAVGAALSFSNTINWKWTADGADRHNSFKPSSFLLDVTNN